MDDLKESGFVIRQARVSDLRAGDEICCPIDARRERITAIKRGAYGRRTIETDTSHAHTRGAADRILRRERA